MDRFGWPVLLFGLVSGVYFELPDLGCVFRRGIHDKVWVVLLFTEAEVASKSVHFHLVAASDVVDYQEDHEQRVS